MHGIRMRWPRRSHGQRALLGVLALIAGATLLTTGADANSPTYLDSRASAAARAGDLLGRMTLAEKAGQMTQIRLGKLRGDCQWTPGPLQPNCMKDVLADHVTGSILSGGGDYPVPDNTPQAWAEMTNAIQKYAIENSRLHVPVIYGADGVHGHNNLLGATLFPQQLGLAATWDPALVTASTTSTRHAMLATGVHWDFAPVADLARDTRWGRYFETFGEDPYLAGSLDAAAVDGLQGDRNHPALAATVKHFGAYSQPLNGHDRVPADVSVRYLQDTLLRPYQAEVDAGVLTAMANSGAVNGVPAHASKYLLTGQLRDRMGFDGVVVSDWQDVRNLVDAYHLAPDYEHAIAMSVNAGLDMAMEPSEAGDFQTNLIKAVHDGLISQHRIDQSVRRILTLKFRLGLFEHPYVDAAAANGLVYGADTDVARQAAAESAVLLKNSGSALPLAGTAKVVVTGPNADNGAAQLGGWSIGWQGVPAGVTPPAETIRQAFDTETGGQAVYAPDQASAVAALRSADVAVAVIGETTPGAEGLNDSENPVVPANQQALVAALKATGKPVVVVMIASRPLVLGSVADDASALLMAWLPGSKGGPGVVDDLYGTVNPSGRLPVSWPKTVGDEPMFYQQLPGTNGGPSSGYDPAYAFGAGLSYTTFTTSLGAVTSSVSRNGTVSVPATVTNTGTVAGTDVVPVYVRQPTANPLEPDHRLVGYTRVALAAGASKTVTVKVPASRLAVTAGDVDTGGPPTVQAGGYQILVGTDTAPFTVH